MGRLLCFVLSMVTLSSFVYADNWPQFRGPGATGVSLGSATLPTAIGPGQNQLWKIPLAKGHSSPVVFEDRVYLTSVRDQKLLTIAVDARNGKIVWEREAPYEKLESIHRIGSRATASVATDGKRVVSFFGSSGLFCYDVLGNPLWQKRLGPFNNQFGATSSPVLVDDRVVLVEDHDTGSFLATFNKHTGREMWRVERPNFRRNYGSPTIWSVAGHKQIVVAGTAHVIGYDLETGKQLWVVRGLCRVISNTPVVGDDGKLYVASTGGGSASRQPAFDRLVAAADANANGVLEPTELPGSPIKGFFGQFDRDGSGALDRDEYESIREIFAMAQPVALAIRPGGRGDVTESHVEWTYSKSIPRNSSPLLVSGHLFIVKDGGVMTCLDSKTGKPTRTARLAASDKYYSSPVAGDGKIYVLSERGTLSVVSAQPDWKILHRADFDEDVLATPAIANGCIYIRTVGHLYCFGMHR